MKKKYGFGKNLKFLYKTMLSNEKKYMIVLFLLPIISLSVSIADVFLPKTVLDRIIQNQAMPSLIYETTIFILFIATFKILQAKFKNILEIKSWEFYFSYGQRQVEKKKMTVDYNIYSSPYGKLVSERALYSVCGNPESSFVSLFSSLKDCIVNLITIICFSIILSKLNPLIVIFLLLSYIIDGIVALMIETYKKKLRETDAGIWQKKRYISQHTTLADFAKDIRIFNLKELINVKQKIVSKEDIKNTDKKEIFTIIQILIEAMLVFLRDGAAYCYLVYKTLNHNITIGDFTLYFTIITCFGIYLQNSVNCIQKSAQANNNLKFFREFMDCADEQSDIKNVLPIKKHTIRLENVGFSYPNSDTMTLKNINLIIEPDKSYALVGINGVGKTTLAKLLCGLLRPTEGKIFIDDIDITKISSAEYYNCFSVIFQESCLMPVSIAENITLTHKNFDEKKLKNCIEDAELEEKIASLKYGYKTIIGKQFDESGTELSGGETQKVLLARALYKDAPILILDEPTAAMDPVSEEHLYKKYRNLTKGKTSIFITHRLSSTRFCEKVLLLDGNEIKECGTHEELYNLNGKYRKLFDISAKFYNEVKEDV